MRHLHHVEKGQVGAYPHEIKDVFWYFCDLLETVNKNPRLTAQIRDAAEKGSSLKLVDRVEVYLTNETFSFAVCVGTQEETKEALEAVRKLRERHKRRKNGLDVIRVILHLSNGEKTSYQGCTAPCMVMQGLGD